MKFKKFHFFNIIFSQLIIRFLNNKYIFILLFFYLLFCINLIIKKVINFQVFYI